MQKLAQFQKNFVFKRCKIAEENKQIALEKLLCAK
jgi:hypothetical protein